MCNNYIYKINLSLIASLNKLNNSVSFKLNFNRLNYLLNKFDLKEEEFFKKTEIKKENIKNKQNSIFLHHKK